MKILSIIFVLLFIQQSYSQNFPKSFEIGNSIQNIDASENPVSNSISDMVMIGDTIYLATSRGLSKSIDRGNSWINFYGTDAFGTESISSIGYYNGIIWTATAHSLKKDNQFLPVGSGIRFSTDGGGSWKVVPQPLDKDNDTIVVYGINQLRALPVTVAVQNIIYDMSFTPNYIWISTFAGGLRKSRIDSLIINPNAKWERVVLPPDNLNSIKPTDTLRFALQPVGGRFGNESHLNHRVFSVLASNDSTLWVGTANGINRSTDGGVSWRKLNYQNQDQSISGNFVVALDYNSFNNTIWAATWKAEDQNEFTGVSYSDNNGETWKRALAGERTHNFGIFKNFVIACTDNGPFLSSGFGNQWILPATIIDSRTKLRLRTTTFYAAGVLPSNEQIFLGTNDGLVENKFIGSNWSDNWKISFASQPVQQQSETYAFPNPFSPRQEEIKIFYSTGGNERNVTIRIFDFGMNLVRTVVQNVKRGNFTHQVTSAVNSGQNGVIDFWDGKDDVGIYVPNGVYFYRVEFDNDESIFGKIMVLQ